MNIEWLQPKTGARRETGGFTLLEILAVLAVVSLLVALMVPAYGRARAAAVPPG